MNLSCVAETVFDHLQEKPPYLFLRFAAGGETKSMETFAWRLSKVYYLCLHAFHSLPSLSSPPSFSCHSAALIFIPLVCLSFTRRIHPTYQLQPSNRFPPSTAFHMEIHFLWILKETFQLWPGRLNLGLERRGGHILGDIMGGYGCWRSLWMFQSLLVECTSFKSLLVSIPPFQKKQKKNCKQNTRRIQIWQFLSCFETKRSEEE